jgi:hypothetical protein
VQQWVTAQMELWNSSPDHSGSILPLPVAPTEKCDPALTPGRLQKPTLTILAPAEDGTVTYPAFRPKISSSVGSKIRELSFSIDGKRVAVRTAESFGSAQDLRPFDEPLRVPRSIDRSGSHTFTVTLVDEYYNAVTETVRFRFGEAGPLSVHFVSPSGDLTLEQGGMLELEAVVDDSEGSMKYIQFFLDDTLLTTKPKEPFTLSYGLTVSPGTYRVRVVATDLSGKMTEDQVTLTVMAKQ